jgi:hypothetical protein
MYTVQIVRLFDFELCSGPYKDLQSSVNYLEPSRTSVFVLSISPAVDPRQNKTAGQRRHYFLAYDVFISPPPLSPPLPAFLVFLNLHRLPSHSCQPCYFTLPASVPQLILLLTKYSTLLCPLPHSVGLLKAVICLILSPLAHSAICPKLPSASLCHLPHLFPFPLVFPLLCSVLCFILPPALLCPLTHFCHLPHNVFSYSLLFVSLSSPLQFSTLPLVPLFPILSSASLCPLLHSDLCSTLTSALLCPFLHSDFLFHSDLSSILPPPSLCFCSSLTSAECVTFSGKRKKGGK